MTLFDQAPPRPVLTRQESEAVLLMAHWLPRVFSPSRVPAERIGAALDVNFTCAEVIRMSQRQTFDDAGLLLAHCNISETYLSNLEPGCELRQLISLDSIRAAIQKLKVGA